MGSVRVGWDLPDIVADLDSCAHLMACRPFALRCTKGDNVGRYPRRYPRHLWMAFVMQGLFVCLAPFVSVMKCAWC